MSSKFVCIPDMQVAAGLHAQWKSTCHVNMKMQSCVQQELVNHAVMQGKVCPCRLRQPAAAALPARATAVALLADDAGGTMLVQLLQIK